MKRLTPIQSIIEALNLHMADLTPNSDFNAGYVQALNDMVDVAKELLEREREELERAFNQGYISTLTADHYYTQTYDTNPSS